MSQRIEYPERRPIRGHDPDCPYGHDRAVEPRSCPICQGIRKGEPDAHPDQHCPEDR